MIKFLKNPHFDSIKGFYDKKWGSYVGIHGLFFGLHPFDGAKGGDTLEKNYETYNNERKEEVFESNDKY